MPWIPIGGYCPGIDGRFWSGFALNVTMASDLSIDGKTGDERKISLCNEWNNGWGFVRSAHWISERAQADAVWAQSFALPKILVYLCDPYRPGEIG